MSDPLPPVACPNCHTAHALADDALETEDHWTCVRCGQRWNAHRLETVAAYAGWVAEGQRA